MLLFALTLFSGQNVHAATSNAAIKTDQSDYVTGSIVTIFGSGFSPSAGITVSVTDPNNSTTTWSVSSDSLGGFTTYYQLDHVNGNYLVTASDGVNSASTSFHDATAAANIDQCTNGAVGSPPESCLNSLANWVNGNANGNKAHWQEGDFIAYRVSVTGVTAGSHNIVFSWDTVHSKGHAIDYIGSVNFTETFSITPTPFHANNNNPCIDIIPGQCTSSIPGFNSAASPAGSIAVPVANEATAVTCDSAGGTFSGTQIPGKIFIWGPTGTSLTTLAYLSENAPSGTGQCTTTAQLNFNVGGSASSNTVVIAWGGHIATQTNWGVGNSASGISGSPYHTSLDTLDGASVGSQDRALSTTSIFFTPTISTTVINESTGLAVVSPLPLGTSVHDTATLSSASLTPTGTVTYKFYANGACSGTPSTTQTVTLSGGLIPNSASTGPLAAGSYSYNATYSGDSINFPKVPNSACEPFKVNPAATTTTTAIYKTGTKSPDLQGTTQTAGISVYDNATVSPKVDSIPITGTVTFTFYTSGDCTTGGTAQSPVTLTSSSPFSAISNSHVLSTPGSYSFRAAYSGDSNYNASISGCETIRILSAPLQPTITKTVAASFTRTYTWSISKAVDQTVIDIAFGGTATFHYTIVATGTTTDTNFQTSGTITVGNPNPGSMSITSVTDADSNGGICTIGTGSLGDSPSGPFTLPATATESFPYTCTFSSNPGSGTDTATVTWPTQSIVNTSGTLAAGSATSPAAYNFGSATITTVGSATVTVTDTLPDNTVVNLGNCTAPTSPGSGSCTFTDSFTTNGVGGTCTSYTNTAALSTGQTDSRTVQVCVGLDLTVSKTASPTFTRTYLWSISKTVDSNKLYTAGGTPATFNYHVTVTNTGFTDSLWAISGTITVTNPNDWEAIAFNLADSAGLGSSCSITGGSGPFTVSASSSKSFTYSCTFGSGASGTNTATATWSASTYFTPTGSASGSAGFSFTTPTTLVDTSVSVTDTLGGSLGTCSVSSSPCTFNYSKTFTDPAGTCTSHDNTATFTTSDTHTTGSASQTVTDCQGADLTASKTATPTFTRTFQWGISKTVDNNQIFTAGGSPGTVTYTISVTHDAGTDSAWAITGTITVNNPNDWEAITFSLSDFTTGNVGACSITGGSGPFTVAASSSMSFSYSCTFGSGASGSNTATATWDSSAFHTPTGSASGSASFAFNTPTTIVDGSVSVSDSVQGFIGTVSYTDPSPTTFTYSQTFNDPAGTCTSHTNTATFTTNNTGSSGSSSQTVTDCQGADLIVSKTATPTFTRTFHWGIAKSVDNNNVFTSGGAPATVNYDVTITHDAGTDSSWMVTGTITVINPNNWEAITLTSIGDLASGGVCTVTAGPMTVPASSSIAFSYSCTFGSGASGTNTATATWDSSAFHTPTGSASGSAAFAFTTPTTIVDGSVTVTDSSQGFLGTVLYTDPSATDFTYSQTFTDPAGTCTTHSNTATFTTNTTGTTGSASQTVTDCQGADLTVSKTATPTFTRTFHWGISKTVDNNQIFTAGGGPGTVTYTVAVTHDAGTDSAWMITGSITVHNPNNWEAITFNLSDSAGLGSSCSITGGSGPYSIPAGATQSYNYSCTFSSGASGSNTATASWDSSAFHTPDASASGTAPFAFTTPTTIVDGSVSVSDSVQGFIGTVSYTDASPKTFTYSQTFNDPAGTCTGHTNTAIFTTNNTGTTGSSSQTVTDCQGADLTVSKTATPTFTRTFHWGISKTVDKNQIFTAGGSPGTVNYSVSVTHDSGTDSAWAITGTITVTNPNDWEAISFTLTDIASSTSCSISGGSGPYTVAASSSKSFTYSCTMPSGASGTNTATATWSASTYHTPSSSASGSAPFAFTTPTTIVDGSVSVSDSVQGFIGTVSYTDPSPKTFTYSQTFTDPAGTCTSHTNTATFTTNTTGTTGSASQTVTDCQGADLTVSKTATPTFTRTFTWSISKSVDKTLVYLSPSGGTTTFTYTISVTHDSGTDSLWQVTGTITVTNPNNWEAITTTVTDAVDNGGSCTVTGGVNVSVPASGSVSLPYTCTYSSAPSSTSGTNTATATWNAATYSTPDGTATGSAGFSFATPTTIVDGSVVVKDLLPNGVTVTLGTVQYTDPSPTTFTDTFTTGGVVGACTLYTNTATFTTNTTRTTGSASQTVDVCVVTSQIKTSVSPLTTSIPRTATDTATVTLSPSGQTVSGTVTFKVYGPFSSAPTSTSCSSGSLFATLGPVTIGPGVSPQSVTSPSFTPSTMGYYTVVATYNPASVANGNSVSTSCADPSETLLVSPQSQVTNTSFCPIQNNQFPLNLITDPQTPSAFKLVSTNPGQFYDNVFYFDGAGNPVSLTIAIPFPFVTQGAVPIQVSSSFGIVNGCFSPSFDATSQFTITATGGTLSSSGNPIIILGDYSTQQLGQYVYITVSGTVPASGLVYVTVHMNYGLRSQDFNKVTTGTASGTPTGISCTVNPCAQWTSSPSVIIGSPEPYNFTVTGSLTTSFGVTSVNNFKKDPGFAGVLTNADGSAVVGAVVKIYDSSGTLLGITTTDQNGVYLFAYKYTGPQTTFTLKVTSPTGVTQTATVSMKSNQLALTNFLFG